MLSNVSPSGHSAIAFYTDEISMSEFYPGSCNDQHIRETGCCSLSPWTVSPQGVLVISSEGADGTQPPLTPLMKVYWSGTMRCSGWIRNNIISLKELLSNNVMQWVIRWTRE